jgi:hypothetical protein
MNRNDSTLIDSVVVAMNGGVSLRSREMHREKMYAIVQINHGSHPLYGSLELSGMTADECRKFAAHFAMVAKHLDRKNEAIGKL